LKNLSNIKTLLLLTILLGLPTKVCAGYVTEINYGYQSVAIKDLNTKIYRANETDGVEKMPELYSMTFYRVALIYTPWDSFGFGLRYTSLDSGEHIGKYAPTNSALTWSLNLKTTLLYLTGDWFIEDEDFQYTLGFGVGYTLSNKLTSEYKESTHSTLTNSKMEFESKTMSYLVYGSAAWKLFESFNLFVDAGYRILQPGKMKAISKEGSRDVAIGDNYKALTTGNAVDFDLSGYFFSIGLRISFGGGDSYSEYEY
jgi:hypothetical protein